MEMEQKKQGKTGGERTQGHRCGEAERREENWSQGFLGSVGFEIVVDDVGTGFEGVDCGC